MKVNQFVMAYEVEQDRLRACIPTDFLSLRPVLRINCEIIEAPTKMVYLEFNTAVEGYGKRAWLNIGNWDNKNSKLSFYYEGDTVVFTLPYLKISFTGVGIKGSCPAEKDDQGCFFLEKPTVIRPPEFINEEKEFCNCEFNWELAKGGAHGVSIGKTLPAHFVQAQTEYERCPFTVENMAIIPCKQVLGTYQVTFERNTERIKEKVNI